MSAAWKQMHCSVGTTGMVYFICRYCVLANIDIFIVAT